MQAQMQVPTLSKVNKILIGTYVAIFILSKIFEQSGGVDLGAVLGLSYEGVTSGLIFQFFTYPFMDYGFTGVLFNALLIWFIGSDLELKWGTRFYIKFLIAANLGAGIFYFTVFGLMLGSLAPLFGMTGTNLALILAYGIIYSERTMLFMFIFPMQAKYFCMILAAIELYMGLFSKQSEAAWSHLFAMFCAFIYLKYKSLKARGVDLASVKREYHRKKMKGNLTLLKGDESSPDSADSKDPKFWQ